jgi:hypothetical protein
VAFRNISVDMGVNTAPYVAGMRAAAQETRTFATTATNAGQQAEGAFKGAVGAANSYTSAANSTASATKKAETNIAAMAKRNVELRALAMEYRRVAEEAEKGSARQVSAARLVEVSNKRLAASGMATVPGGQGQGTTASQEAGIAAAAQTAKSTYLAAGVAVHTLIRGQKLSIDASSDLNESQSKSVQVFGESAAAIERFGETAPRSLGQSKQATIEAAATFGTLLRGIGQTQPEAAKMSMAVVKLATDLASFSNLDTADVLGDIKSGLVGEAEPMRKHGVLLSEAAVKSEAYSSGIAKLGAELTEQQKVQARYNIILQQTTIAQGDFARTADGTANKEKTLAATAESLKTEIGSGLVPMYDKLVTAGTFVGESTLAIADKIGGLGNVIGAVVRGAAGPLSAILDLIPGKQKKTGDAIEKTDEQLAKEAATLLQTTAATDKYNQSIEKLAAEAGLSVGSLTAALGYTGAVGADSFDKVTASAQTMVQAINAGVNATSSAFLKSVDAVSHFSASSLAANVKRETASTRSANTLVNNESRVGDAIEHVADLQEQFAEKAAADREAYAEKVIAANQRVIEADERYAEVVEDTNRRVADSEERHAETIIAQGERVAEAEDRLADLRIDSAQRVKDAKDNLARDVESSAEGIADAEERLASLSGKRGKSPAQLARLAQARELKEAEENLAKARKRALEVQEKGEEAVRRAEEDHLTGVAKAEADLTRARKDQIKSIADAERDADDARKDRIKSIREAEENVTKAKAEQTKLAAEEASIGVQTLAQTRQMEKALDAVTKAQQTLGVAAEATGEQQAEAVKVTVEEVKRFYETSLAEGKRFADGIRGAIKKGYDPGFISRLLQEGPREAAPILEAIAQDQDNSLRDLVNASEKAIDEMNTHIREVARLTFLATTSGTDEMNRDFSAAMGILEQNSRDGGRRTAQAIAAELEIGVGEVERIARNFGIKLADGINPVLTGIGAVPVTMDQQADRTYSGIQQFAGGGHVPGTGDGDTVAAMLTPGEYVLSKPAVQRLGVDFVDSMHQGARRGFAAGGFVTADDVPLPPDYSAYGDKAGYAGSKTSEHGYNAVVAYLNGRPKPADPGTRAGEGDIGDGEIGTGWRAITDYLDSVGQDYIVTSTVRPGAITSSGNLSNHAVGKAVDMDGDMPAIFNTLLNIAGSLSELFYDPAGYSIKNGQRAEFIVGGHEDHVHAATFDRGGFLQPGMNLAWNGLGVPEPVGVTAMALGARHGGGDIVVNVTVNGPALGTTGEQIAATIAEPLRAIYARRGRNNAGDYLGRS